MNVLFVDIGYEKMFINIRHNCALQENSKKVSLNSFFVPGLKETLVIQLSPSLLSPNFHSGKTYV